MVEVCIHVICDDFKELISCLAEIQVGEADHGHTQATSAHVRNVRDGLQEASKYQLPTAGAGLAEGKQAIFLNTKWQGQMNANSTSAENRSNRYGLQSKH